MTVAVLGPLAVDGDDHALSPRDRVVLAALVAGGGEPVRADALADALWGDAPPASAAKVVQGCVARLRRTLGAAAIQTSAQGYRLVLAADRVDVRRFERLVGRGRELMALGEYERAAYTAREALRLWRGRALADLDGWETGRVEAGRLDGLRLDAEELRLDAALRAGHHREVLVDAHAAVAAAPLREQRWALLATAQYQCGQQADALASLQRARGLLASELGLDPGPELVRLEQAILRQDPALAGTAPPPDAESVCPYRGLLAYEVADADGFFGRDADVAACLARFAATGTVTVVGASGSGKSSLVRAGVAAALRRNGDQVVVVTPGSRPMDALTALPPGRGAVLVVDQLEEATTMCPDQAERTRFFAALTALAEARCLVLALRADRMGDLASHPDFARVAEPGLYLLGPLGEPQLREAIDRPARQSGLRLEPGLADLLVEEVLDEPGALPLLSHALRRTWERREGRTLTIDGYRAAGGIRGAVAQSAEQVYEQVPDDQRDVLRDVLLRLVTPTPGEPSATQIPREDVAADPIRAAMIERLVAARLVTADDEVIQVAHEALFRAWPRLRDWLEEDVAGQRLLRHLVDAAATWEAMGRPDSELYRGTRLAQATAWRESSDRHLTGTETAFLDASTRLADAERTAALEQARQQQRTNRRLRGLLAGVAGLLIVALLAGVLAARQATRANRQASRADHAATAADARRVGAQALVTDDLDRSLLLAVEGARLDPSPDTDANLLATLARNPDAIASIRGDQGWTDAAASADGTLLALVQDLGPARFYDTRTRRRVGAFTAFTASAVAFRPDGGQVAVGAAIAAKDESDRINHGYDARPLRLIDPATRTELPTRLGGLPPQPKWVESLAYSAAGRYLAGIFSIDEPVTNAQLRSVLAVWDLRDPSRPIRSITLAPSYYQVALSPDGRRAYTSRGGPAQVASYDVASGKRVAATEQAGGAVALSADGTRLAANAGNDILMLDPATLASRTRLRGHTAWVDDLAFSTDGSKLISASDDRTVGVSDTVTGNRLQTWRGHAGAVYALATAADVGDVWSASADGSALAWNPDGTGRLAARRPVRGASVDGNWLALAAPDASTFAYYREFNGDLDPDIQFVDTRTRRAGRVIDTRHDAFGAVAWRPDSRALATTGADGYVRVWDKTTGGLLAQRHVARSHLSGIDYTDHGVLIASERNRSLLHILNASTLEPVRPPTKVRGEPILWAFASPDGRRAVTLTQSGYALTDLRRGTVTARRTTSDQPFTAQFAPDGTRLVIGFTDGKLAVVNTATGRFLRPPILGHHNLVDTTAYSPDGNRIVSAATDGTAALWDGDTGALIGTLPVSPPEVAANAGFAPDGHTVLALDVDGSLTRWDTTPQSWIRYACHVAGRNLTEAEWRDSLGDRPYRPSCPPDA